MEVVDQKGESQSMTRRRANESSIFHWPEERFRAMMDMKEEALQYGRHIWADYVLVSYYYSNNVVVLINRQRVGDAYFF